MGRLFENAVYLQLLYKGWRVHVGKLYNKEVDFVAVKDGRTVYLQVTDQMLSEGAWKRELGPLRSIHDSYEKCVIVRQGRYEQDAEGIGIIQARDFFLGDMFRCLKQSRVNRGVRCLGYRRKTRFPRSQKSKRVAASATPVSYLFKTSLATGRAEGLAFKQGGERHLAA